MSDSKAASDKANTSAKPAEQKPAGNAAEPAKKPAEKKTAEKKHPAEKKAKEKKPPRLIAWLGFLIAIAAAGDMYFLWTQHKAVKYTVQEHSAQFDAQDVRIKQKLTDQQATLDAEMARLRETNEGFQKSFDQIYSRIGNTTRDWVIAEADYLLQIANRRLQLEQDIPTAIHAMKLADARIKSLPEPALISVRKTLATEISSLETLEQIDIEGMALELGALAEQLDQLPLKRNQAEPEPVKTETDPSKLPSFWSGLWEAIKQLIIIRRIDKPMEPLMSADEHALIVFNIQLKLEQARLALLQGQEKLFKQSLSRAENWLSSYYDTSHGSAEQVKKKLQALQQKSVKVDAPSIGDSLQQLRKAAQKIRLGSAADKVDTKPASKTDKVAS